MDSKRLQQLTEALVAAENRVIELIDQRRPWPEIKAADQAATRCKREIDEARRAESGSTAAYEDATPNLDSMMQAAQEMLGQGFEIIDHRPDDQRFFGNAMLQLAANDLVVQLIVDRSQREVILSLPNAPEERADLSRVLEQLGVSNTGSAAWPSFSDAVTAILAHRDVLPRSIPPARAAMTEHWARVLAEQQRK